MADETVTEQAILKALHQVPQDRWVDVQAYLRSVAPSFAGEKRPMTAADLLQSGLVGLWADRADIGADRGFARCLREQAQTRRRDE